jgi:plastocyanin
MLPLLRASAGYSLRPALAIVFVVLLAAACAVAGPSAPVATDQVDLPRSYQFVPADITVPVGTTVSWTNNDNFTHTVRLLDTGEDQVVRQGETVTHAFTQPGLFRYDCSLHPNDMQGSVLVEAGSE